MEKKLRTALKPYKRDMLPVVLILAGIGFVVWLILPQISEVENLQSEIETQEVTNSQLAESQSTLNSYTAERLDAEYQLLLAVLPDRKSIGAIYDGLARASSEAQVEIGSLSIQLGNVYSVDEQQETRNAIEGIPYVNLIVRATGSSESELRRFADILYQSAPMVEINSIGISGTEGRYDVNYYFKPLAENSFAEQNVVLPLSPSQQNLLTELQDWVD